MSVTDSFARNEPTVSMFSSNAEALTVWNSALTGEAGA